MIPTALKDAAYIQDIRDVFMEELLLQLIGHIDADEVQVLKM